MVSTKTQIAGFEFDNCLMNAAGVACMTTEELEEVKNSVAGTFVTKTATLEFRAGNPEPRYQDVPLGSINSMGLPNQGLDYYLNYLLELQETDPDRTFFLSLVGMSPEETHTILKKVQDSDFKGLTELNLSCPNVPGKPQIAYDFDTTDRILSEVLPISPNLLASSCHLILISFILIRRQRSLTNTRSSLSIASIRSEMASTSRMNPW